MRLFITIYELRKLIFEGYEIHDRDITLLHIYINKMYGRKMQYMFHINKCSISIELISFRVKNRINITDLLIYIVNVQPLS
jgi:hypothetical protein